MVHYTLKPENCGDFGRKVLYGGQLTDRPPAIYRLDFEFKSWPIDDLIEINCTYIATEALIACITALSPKATGIFFDNFTSSTTFEMRRDKPGQELPPLKWCKISGKPGIDDFGMSKDHNLVVSERALLATKPKLNRCIIEVYKADPAPSKDLKK